MPWSNVCESLTVNVQSPAPVSPQNWVLDSVKSMLFWLADPKPGMLTRVLVVPSGEVSETVRSPIQVWLISTATWT